MLTKNDIRLKIQNVETLNRPRWYKLFKKVAKIKMASTKKDGIYPDDFDLEAAKKENPDHLFMKVFAIRENEVNDNADAFSAEELKKAAHTFIGVPIFTNHQNDDIEKAKGKCVHSWYDEEKGGIYIISMVDKVAYAPLARGIEQGYIVGTSMGCSVDYSCCSICHNRAAVADDYCEHIRNQKNRKFSGKIECQYHKSTDDPKDNCPVCGRTHEEFKTGSVKKMAHNEEHIYEWNYGIKFIEDSFVVNPACHDCLVCEVLSEKEVNKKMAEIEVIQEKIHALQKVASCKGSCTVEKVAGQKELKYLDDVMEKIKVVAKSMMAQQRNVSFDYLSDLVEVLASVQSISDELEEMGYGQLPSPDATAVESMDLPKESELNPEAGGVQDPAQQPVMQPQPAQPTAVQTAPGVVSEDFGELGSVTKPKFSENNEIKKKDFLHTSSNMINKLDNLQEQLSNTSNTVDKYSKENKESIMDSHKTGQTEVENEKDAAVITEKQLDDAQGAGERQGKAPNTITEKQMENPDRDVNRTTSETPTERKDEDRGVITEKQFDKNVTSEHVARWNDYPQVITEKQWTDVSRWIGSELSQDQDTRITEKQLLDFRNHHNFVLPGVITEKQLGKQTGDLSRVAFNASDLVKIASDAISDSIAFYGKTPNDVARASEVMNENSKTLDKAAFLVLLNALPNKESDRKNEKERYTYFSKVASSVKTPNTVDALIVSMSDHIQEGMSADDLISAVYHVAHSDKAIQNIEDMVKSKLSSETPENALDKMAQIQQAITEMNKSDDGLYRVDATMEEINPKENTKKAVTKAAYKFANKKVAEEVGMEVDTALIDVTVDSDKNVVMTTIKDVNTLTAEETEKWKEAQFGLGLGLGRDVGHGHEHGHKPGKGLGLEKLVEKLIPELAGDGEEGLNLEIGDWNDEDWAEEDLLPCEEKEEDAVEDVVDIVDDDIQVEEEGEDKDMRFMLASRKEGRNKTVKEAQMMGGEMGGQGGAAQGPGAGATMPQPPGAAGAPVESFEEADLGGEFDETGDLMPKPPGSICPVCGSEDLDVIKGEGQCNNCTSEFKYKVAVEVTKWSGLLGEDTGEEGEDIEDVAGLEGEGFEMPETPVAEPMAAPAAPAAASTKNDKVKKLASQIESVPFAASTRITPKAINVLKEAGIELATVSPLTGSTNTVKIAGNQHVCLDTGVAYTVDYKVSVKDPKKVYAQWAWTPEDAYHNCSDCEKSRKAFAVALNKEGVAEADFDSMSPKAKGDVIMKMKSSGSLKNIKTASTEEKVIDMIKKASVELNAKQFPMATCIEKLARRYGEDSLALSGPCEGKSLPDCVCQSLKSAKVYSNGLAVKIAEVWNDKDGSTECLEDYVRMGFELKQASTICDAMKNKYASLDDKFAQELEEFVGEEIVEDEAPMVEEADPFDEPDEFEDGGDAVSDALVQLTKALGKEEEVSMQLEGEPVVDESPMGDDIVSDESPMGDDIVPDEDPMGDDMVVDEGPVVEDEHMVGEEPGVEEDITDELGDSPEDMAAMKGGDVLDEGLEVEVEVEGEGDLASRVEKIEEKLNIEEGESEDTANKEDKNENPGVLNPQETDEPVEKEGDDEEDKAMEYSEDSGEEYTERQASVMRKGYVGKTDEITHLDFSKLTGILEKEAGQVKSSPAQDNVPFQYSGNGNMGDEDGFSADNPSAPSKGDASAMGDEHPPKGDTVDIPTSDARMDGEKQEPELKPELDDTATGGDKGQGASKAASYNDGVYDMADRIIAAQKQIEAQNKRVERKFDQDVEDIKPYSDGNGFIGDEKASIGDVPAAKPAAEQGVPRKDDFIGDEKASIGEKPSEKMMPEVPVKDDRIDGEKDNDKLTPEKDNEMTGDVRQTSAGSDVRRKEATRIAGRMLQAGKVEVDKLATKIAELERYEIEQLKDLEKSIFAVEKGLDKPSDGLEQTPVISQEKNEMQKIASAPMDGKEARINETAGVLDSMFTLSKMNHAAQEDTDIQLRKEHGR